MKHNVLTTPSNRINHGLTPNEEKKIRVTEYVPRRTRPIRKIWSSSTVLPREASHFGLFEVYGGGLAIPLVSRVQAEESRSWEIRQAQNGNVNTRARKDSS